MRKGLVGSACTYLVIVSANCNAELISSYSYGDPTSLGGTRTTLDEILPGRFQLIYGDLLVCQDPPDCDFWDPNPLPPIATVFDIEISGPVSHTFILDSGPDFDTVVNLATDGSLDQMNYGLEYIDGTGYSSLDWTESSIYGVSGDLSGFDISSFELLMNVTFESPGRDPNGDGIWVDSNNYWTFNVYGEPIPMSLAIDIEKLTNGNQADDANDSDVPRLLPGETVTWTYEVTNTGQVALSEAEVVVTDSQSGIMPLLEFSSDADGDAILSPGEKWIYTATAQALDLRSSPAGATVLPGCNDERNTYRNIGRAEIADTAIFDEDLSHYCNFGAAEIDIRKQSEGPDTRTFPIGSDASFEIQVTNLGTVDLDNVAVTDTEVPDCNRDIGLLAAGSSITYTCTASAVAWSLTGKACVTGKHGGVSVEDCDSSTLITGCNGCAALAAAVLPTSRSVGVGHTATAFATVINTLNTTAVSCGLAPMTPLPASFSYQLTDPATNALVGTPNTPVDITAGSRQTYLFTFTPTAAFDPTDVHLGFDCANTDPAPVMTGLNTLLMSASDTSVLDILALAATPSGDGIADIGGIAASGAFAVAVANIGATADVTASVDTGGVTLPVAILICETNPSTGLCVSPAQSSVVTNIGSNGTATFTVFLSGRGTVPFDPANNRIFVRFWDAGGITRGSTSVAVRTQ